MHIFLGLPISEPLTKLDLSAKKEYLKLVKAFIRLLRADGKHTVFCALEAEDWGKNLWFPEYAMIRDLNEMERASIILFLFTKSYLSSALVELGWATALRKRVLVFQHVSVKPVYLVEGLAKNSKISLVNYKDREDLMRKASKLLVSVISV